MLYSATLSFYCTYHVNQRIKENEADGWGAYWTGAQDTNAFTGGGVSHPLVASFWRSTLPEVLGSTDRAMVLDIASGSGAVVEILVQQPGIELSNITCVDLSKAAIAGLTERFAGLTGIVCDAKSIPLASGRFDLVTSQFGAEYAGKEAVSEAARLVAPGGSLVCLLHKRPGVIYEECDTALSAIRRTQQCNFVSLARQLFETGFAAVRGADRAPYEIAAAALNPAILELESLLEQHGEHVAGGTVARLYGDVARIHGRMPHYSPDEVLSWLDGMDFELEQYARRMASMCSAALDANSFADVCDTVKALGFALIRSDTLDATGSGHSLAWVLHASRGS